MDFAHHDLRHAKKNLKLHPSEQGEIEMSMEYEIRNLLLDDVAMFPHGNCYLVHANKKSVWLRKKIRMYQNADETLI